MLKNLLSAPFRIGAFRIRRSVLFTMLSTANYEMLQHCRNDLMVRYGSVNIISNIMHLVLKYYIFMHSYQFIFNEIIYQHVRILHQSTPIHRILLLMNSLL